MARIQHIEPTPSNVPESATLEWDLGNVEFARPGTYADDDDHSEPIGDHRRFYTIAVRVDRKRNAAVRVAVLAVTRDLEYAIEKLLPASLDDGFEVQLRDHNRVPPVFCSEVPDDSAIPAEKREEYANVLEDVHGIAPEVSDR